MRQESAFDRSKGLYVETPIATKQGKISSPKPGRLDRAIQPTNVLPNFSRKILIGVLLVIALLAFEIFNFDSTQFALNDFLAEVSFLGIRWATILAVAFCAIDFAGLAYLFGTEQEAGKNKEVWYLMGAWLLGATMNALMTWWAVSVTLLSHEFGNEVLSRSELLNVVPIFVAVLVWLTRILFIGSFSIAGNHLFELKVESKSVELPAESKSVDYRTRRSGSRPLPIRPAMVAQGRRR